MQGLLARLQQAHPSISSISFLSILSGCSWSYTSHSGSLTSACSKLTTPSNSSGTPGCQTARHLSTSNACCHHSSHPVAASSDSDSSGSSSPEPQYFAQSTASSTNSRPRPPPKPYSSLDKKEAAKFAALADEWWDKRRGPFAPLHALNKARCRFIRQGVCSLRHIDQQTGEPFLGFRVLDVGCGGGLLSEPLARLGAQVHGIDVSDEGVAAAAAHAAEDPLLAERIRYQKITLEELVAQGASYDIVMASEVIEHVRRPQKFLADLAAVTQPGGQVFITTINRTPASYAVAIVGAEYVSRVVPQGTHDWGKFITPQELAMMAADAGLGIHLIAGMQLDAGSGQFTLGDNTSVNYAALLSKLT